MRVKETVVGVTFVHGGGTGGAINSTTGTGRGGRDNSVALRDTLSLRLVPLTAPEVKRAVVRKVLGWRVRIVVGGVRRTPEDGGGGCGG